MRKNILILFILVTLSMNLCIDSVRKYGHKLSPSDIVNKIKDTSFSLIDSFSVLQRTIYYIRENVPKRILYTLESI